MCYSARNEALHHVLLCRLVSCRASFGTTTYCNYFLRDKDCPNADCSQLHEIGSDSLPGESTRTEHSQRQATVRQPPPMMRVQRTAAPPPVLDDDILGSADSLQTVSPVDFGDADEGAWNIALVRPSWAT